MAMTELVIFILVEVQANDLTSTSFHPFSLPILPSHSSKLDNVATTVYICFRRKVDGCEEAIQKAYPTFRAQMTNDMCIAEIFLYCLKKHHRSLTKPAYHAISMCINFCTPIKDIFGCLPRCYEYQINHPWDVYTWNPKASSNCWFGKYSLSLSLWVGGWDKNVHMHKQYICEIPLTFYKSK